VSKINQRKLFYTAVSKLTELPTKGGSHLNLMEAILRK